MKIVGYVVLAVVVLLVGAFVAVNVVPWNAFKGMVADSVRDATGRELAINGDLEGGISLGGTLSVSAADVHLANAPGQEPADMVALGSVQLVMPLFPLLAGETKIDSLVVEKPAINLAVDKDGRPNWVFDTKGGGAPGGGDGGGGAMKIGIGELKVVDGTFSYADAVSGQQVKAEQIELTVAPTDLVTPLQVDGSLVLNEEPVTLAVNLDSPQKLIDGQTATAALKLASKHVNAGYDGKLLSQPVPGLDGTFALDVPSVGRLMAWLDRPLAQGQPDPGPLKVNATFAGEGGKMALTEATVDGESLNLKATGSVDATGDVTKVALNVESGVLDIDRYMPPPEPAKPAAPKAAGGGKPGNPLDALSDEPIDVSALRKLDADIKVALAGLKVSGLSFGKIGLTATAKDGVLVAELAPLAMYGGTVAGKVNLDAKADAPAVAASVKVDKVRVDQIAKQAGGETPVVGVANVNADVTAQGKSPRALAQALVGKVAVDLGDVQNAPGGALTEAHVVLDLPGIDAQPSLDGNVVFNKEKVAIAAKLDPLRKVLSADRFDADVKVTAQPVTFAYVGAVQVRPVPGGDGKLDLNVPSVGKLLAWLGQPLDKSQPDPGPLTVQAALQTEGDTFTVKDAKVTGKAVDATANLTLTDAKPRPKFDAQVDVLMANLNAYLPPEQKEQKPAGGGAPAGGGEQGWSREPIDFSGLKQADGKAVINLAKVTYKNLEIDKGRVDVVIDNGVLDAKVEDMALADGTIAATAKIDASGDAAKVNYTASVKNVEARPLLTAFAGSDRLSGTANIEAEGATQGASQYDLVSALDGKGSVQFLNGAIHGINLAATLRKAQSLGFDSEAKETQKTDFAELGGTYTITDGVVDNRDFKMLAPLIRLSGGGLVPMPPQQLDYGVEAKLVASLEGQGAEHGLAGLPIPIKLGGTWASPTYTVDWNSVLQAAAADPERLKNLPGGLSDKAKDLGIALPGLGGATGGDGSKPSVQDALKGVLGGGSSGSTAAPAPANDNTAPAPTEEEKPDVKDAAKDALKGLFK
jgi:AsmA protein